VKKEVESEVGSTKNDFDIRHGVFSGFFMPLIHISHSIMTFGGS
jgi:hypothetical protein